MVMLGVRDGVEAEVAEVNPIAEILSGMGQRQGGQFDAYMDHLTMLAGGAVSSLKQGLSQCRFKTDDDLQYAMGLIECGEYQMLSEAGMRSLHIRSGRNRLTELTRALRRWGNLSDEERGNMPGTKSALLAEINEIEKRIGRLQEDEERDLSNGSKWDAAPLIEWLMRVEKERRGISCSHLLPPMLRTAETFMAAHVSGDAPWFAHMQAIAAQQLSGAALGLGRSVTLDDYAAISNLSNAPRRRMRRGELRE